MLILKRRTTQSIIIDGRIKVTINEARDGHVTLAIFAPDDVLVDREEIHWRREKGEPRC